jgi:branched-chain amino acid transport system substrate-binding protein
MEEPLPMGTSMKSDTYLALIVSGIQTDWECETGYATDKGVECYERLKGKNGGATVFQPLSTGITFALTEKAPATRSR